MLDKLHMPTFLTLVVVIVVLFILYHMTMGKKG
jgi:hypothetical protein